MIFLDNASTTPMSKSAIENLVKYSTENFFNPSAIYGAGYQNFKDIESTKKLLCQKLFVPFKNNIIFTGSATEATNLAILGSFKPSFKKMVFSVGEHPSVYNTALSLKSKGVNVEFVNLQKNGEVDYVELEKMLDSSVNFISIMQVSNETGAINDIAKICQLKKQYCPNAILHCDGVQAFGKIETNLAKLDLDFYTISAHKLHGPKGLGALYAKNPNKLQPIIFGGGQEYNLRSGTENLASIMAFKTALEEIDIQKNFEKICALNKTFKANLIAKTNSKITLKFVENQNLSPYILSVSIPKIKGETLVYMCDSKGLLVSTGSACSAKKSGNRILENLGYDKTLIEGNIRVSFSNFSTLEDIENGSKILANCINELFEKTT
ncbi:MAG: cysteine desulfurase family protein [Clostridia bacterium]|nr:cysteine desulfurase family protein [Clostridia bacterium]